MNSRSFGRNFTNISIKWRFPKHHIVSIINNKDQYFLSECRIIGWTATRVILITVETGERLTRVPSNLSAPYPPPELLA